MLLLTTSNFRKDWNRLAWALERRKPLHACCDRKSDVKMGLIGTVLPLENGYPRSGAKSDVVLPSRANRGAKVREAYKEVDLPGLQFFFLI
jgi:hypothetical protein